MLYRQQANFRSLWFGSLSGLRSGFRVSGFGLRIQGLGFRISALGCAWGVPLQVEVQGEGSGTGREHIGFRV